MKARSAFSRWVRARPLLAFYVLAFGITWLGWLPQAAHSRGLIPIDTPVFYVLGGVGPGLAAWLVLRALHGGDGDRTLFAPLLRWRVGLVWYAVALALPTAICLAGVSAAEQLGSVLSVSGPGMGLLLTFALYLVAAVPEEVGWRGFALPRLQDRHSALTASLIVGVLWALWHLPLLWNADNVMSSYPLIPWLAGVVAITVVYTWLFNSTAGSVLIVTVFHGTANTAGSLSVGYQPTEAIVTGLAAMVIVALFGRTHLSRRRRVNDAPAAIAATE